MSRHIHGLNDVTCSHSQGLDQLNESKLSQLESLRVKEALNKEEACILKNDIKSKDSEAKLVLLPDLITFDCWEDVYARLESESLTISHS